MAIRIPFSKISRELGKKILDETTVVEKLSYVPGIKHQPSPIQVQMFRDIGDYILLPFNYAKSLGYNHHENQMNKWIRLNASFPFIGVMRDYQNEILVEAIEILGKNNSIIIGTPPGSGKTIMASKLWYEIGFLGIVITNRVEVFKGWIKTFKTVCPECTIWIPGNEFPNKMPDIIISMADAVEKIPEEIRLSIGTLIVDEVHLLCTPTRNKMFLSFEPRFVILETATLEMNNGMDKMATLVAGKEGVFRISKVPYNIYFIPTYIFGNQEYGKSGLISASLQKSLASNPMRQDIIMTIIKNNLHRKYIAMHRVTTGIEELVEKSRAMEIEADSLYGSKKSYSNSKLLVGTVSKMGTGFDESNACSDFYLNPEKSNTLIMVNSIKGWQLFEQVRGRVMRSDNPCVIWLMDENPSVLRHFDALKPWFEKTNGNIIFVPDFNELYID